MSVMRSAIKLYCKRLFLEALKKSDYYLHYIGRDNKTTLLTVIISLSLCTSSAYAQQGVVTQYFSVQVPDG
jgi:hypothetical protein